MIWRHSSGYSAGLNPEGEWRHLAFSQGLHYNKKMYLGFFGSLLTYFRATILISSVHQMQGIVSRLWITSTPFRFKENQDSLDSLGSLAFKAVCELLGRSKSASESVLVLLFGCVSFGRRCNGRMIGSRWEGLLCGHWIPRPVWLHHGRMSVVIITSILQDPWPRFPPPWCLT